MVYKPRKRYWRRLVLSAIVTVGMAWTVVAVLPARSASAYTVTQNLTTSSSGTIQTRWYSLRGYGWINKTQPGGAGVYWPQRTNNCGGSGDKISPWQPVLDFVYNGNNINQSSNCADRYSDAGTTVNGGAWINPNAQWWWAQPGPPQTLYWHGAYSAFSTVMGGCSNGSLVGGNAAGIWGAPRPDTSDQFYQSGPIGGVGDVPGTTNGLYYNRYSGAPQATKLFSNGVTLVRDHFDLSATDIANMGKPTTHLYFQAYADDWLQVYVNGTAVGAYSTSTTGEVTLDLSSPAVKGLLRTGTNWLGVMVADKAVFDPSDPGSRGSGVCYNLQYQYDQAPPYNLQPLVNTTITEGGSVIGGNVAQVGDTINFNYAIQNNSWGTSDPANCTVYGDTFTGYHSIPIPPDKGTVQPVGTGCPRTFPGNSTSGVGNQSVVAGAVNQTICRSLYVDPATNGGGERGTESCVVVVARPYAKVFGGDTSAGNRFGTNCIQNTNAGLTSWNREAAGGYAGAGTQFAAKALGSIIDFSSAQNTSGAAAPYGLSFANTTRNASTFGGLFGSLGDCMPDYYGGLPATAISRSVAQVASLSSLGSGVYTVNGNVNIAGNITSGQHIVLYVKGNVNINGNITYPGSWTYDKIPQLEIIAQGDIYVNNNVSQIAGTFVAQSNGASGGWIYSCALSNAPQPLTGSIYNPCQTQLTVNGQLIGEQILLLRTRNSLVPDSSAGETNTNSKAAEIFNFTPADWVAQPPPGSNTNTGLSSRYDAISSLPPVL